MPPHAPAPRSHAPINRAAFPCATPTPRTDLGTPPRDRRRKFLARCQLASGAIGERDEGDESGSLTDLAFVALCRRAYGRLAGWQSDRGWWDFGETYAGMVEVSRALMQGRTPEEQRAAVIAGFPEIPPWFRKLFPYSTWGAELNARITPAFFKWLVGPMETVEVEIDGQKQMSGVHIEKCRYLEESGCTGMCVNLCKAPCQTFFTEELGMPMTMKPNFEDNSCEMIFGQRPPPLEEDEAMQQLANHVGVGVAPSMGLHPAILETKSAPGAAQVATHLEAKADCVDG
ncbi:unnamed protein product, partial [Ostreobium quekettii]